MDFIGRHGTVDTMLFESLVHQLLEKGILAKNDVLSIVQTVAEVTQSRAAGKGRTRELDADLALLRRLYDSFEAARDRSPLATGDQDNIRVLRPPLHQDAPEFPED
jgi:hypothetical protein